MEEGLEVEPVISQAELQKVFDHVTTKVTKRVGGIQLCRVKTPPSGDLYTVYVSFNKGLHFTLALCASASLFVRLTRRMMRSEDITMEDLVDSSKEYFNILCGHIVAELFRDTKIAARFSVPDFCQGRYFPDNRQELFALNYSGDQNETAQLIHHGPVVE